LGWSGVRFSTVFWRADLAVYCIPGAQAEASYLAWGDINVVRACQVGTVCRAQETKPVLQYFQNPAPENILAFLGVRFKDGKNNVLLAGTRGSLGPHVLGDFDQFGGGFEFEFRHCMGWDGQLAGEMVQG
jgi:hypothetical protein